DVPGVCLQLAALDAHDEIGQHRVGAAGDADLLAFAHDEAVHEIDLGAPALLHVLAHRRPLAAGGVLAVLETLLVAGLDRGSVAFAGARDRLRRQMKDLLELIALRLSDTDRLTAKAGGETADRLVLQHLSARQPRAGRQPIAHDVGDELRPAFTPEIV